MLSPLSSLQHSKPLQTSKVPLVALASLSRQKPHAFLNPWSCPKSRENTAVALATSGPLSMEGVAAAAELPWCFLRPRGLREPGARPEVLSRQGWNDLAGLKRPRDRGGRQGSAGNAPLSAGRRGAQVSAEAARRGPRAPALGEGVARPRGSSFASSSGVARRPRASSPQR